MEFFREIIYSEKKRRYIFVFFKMGYILEGYFLCLGMFKKDMEDFKLQIQFKFLKYLFYLNFLNEECCRIEYKIYIYYKIEKDN